MHLTDHLVRIITKDGTFRAVACQVTEAVREACSRHGTMPAASAALGRAIAGGALMGALLKGDQRLALKFEGNGPLRKILVEADAAGNVSGAVGDPTVDLRAPDGNVDVARSLGLAGFLTVTKDLGLKEPYRGMVMLASSQIGEDLAAYLTESEQVPSAVGLGVFLESNGAVSAAGGFLLQALPPQNDAMIDMMMERINTLPPLSELIKEGKGPADILGMLFVDIPCDTLEQREIRFRCTCSRERTIGALVSLGKDELLDLAGRVNPTEVTCEFCRESYSFTPQELQELAAELD
jgi:molecular chaperone Hsp33